MNYVEVTLAEVNGPVTWVRGQGFLVSRQLHASGSDGQEGLLNQWNLFLAYL